MMAADQTEWPDHDATEADRTTLIESLLALRQGRFGAILADPPWRFANRTGKVAPEYKLLSRYATMTLGDIAGLPIAQLMQPASHLYLWVPNALVPEGLAVMAGWGFTYKTNLVWYKTRQDGGPDGRGVGFYFRNVTELVLFGTRGNLRTFDPGRRQVNLLSSQKREHSRKPDELYDIIERCSPGPYLELFARHPRDGWMQWGHELRRARHEPGSRDDVERSSRRDGAWEKGSDSYGG
jgi:N6-adenosine-specific RNA methylase IME4